MPFHHGLQGDPARRAVRSAAFLTLALAVGVGAIRGGETPEPAGRRGGRLVAALRAEPGSLDPLLPIDGPTVTVTDLVHASLTSFDEARQEPRLELAESLDVSEDGRTLTVGLRRGLRFSDGRPLGAEDVEFSFEAVLDEARGSPLRAQLIADGKPARVVRVDPHTVRFELGAPVAAVERLLDGIPILPRGAPASRWSLATPPGEMAGMGPFRFRRHAPGQRIELERNPYYWKRDGAGTRLPYLDQLVFEIVASADAQVLRFGAGETDVISGISAQSFEVLERAHGERVRMRDLGPGLQYMFLLFNLNESTAGAPAGPPAAGWFRERGFREAVSLAVDREAIARLVYRGRAVPIASQETPGNRVFWDAALRPPARSVPAARSRLTESGFSWSPEGALLDGSSRPVELTVLVTAGNPNRPPAAELISEDLRGLGIELRSVALAHGALIERVLDTTAFDTAVLEAGGGDPDPNAHLPFLLSDGRLHLWQRAGRPLFDWEESIDALMRRQVATRPREARVRLYREVQAIVARELPFVPLVSPHELVGARRGLAGFDPAVTGHPVLWNAERLSWTRD